MTGEELYALYQKIWAGKSVGVDAWDDLGRQEQSVWEELALEEEVMPVPKSEYTRGVEAAADVASRFDADSGHRWLISDVILCKLNVAKRKRPRKNKEHFRHLNRGMGLAFAEVLRNGADPDSVLDAMKGAGLTIDELRASGVEETDLEEIETALFGPGEVNIVEDAGPPSGRHGED